MSFMENHKPQPTNNHNKPTTLIKTRPQLKKAKIFALIVFLGVGVLSIGCSYDTSKKDNKYEDDVSSQMPIVIGVITGIRVAEIPNKAKGRPSRFETWISLSVQEAFDKDGKSVDISTYDYPTFAGDSSLIDQYQIDEQVKITCSSITGRHIKEIERLD